MTSTIWLKIRVKLQRSLITIHNFRIIASYKLEFSMDLYFLLKKKISLCDSIRKDNSVYILDKPNVCQHHNTQ